MQSTQTQRSRGKNTLAYYIQNYQYEGLNSCAVRWALRRPLTENLIKRLERHRELIERAMRSVGNGDFDFDSVINELKEKHERKRWCWWV